MISGRYSEAAGDPAVASPAGERITAAMINEGRIEQTEIKTRQYLQLTLNHINLLETIVLKLFFPSQ